MTINFYKKQQLVSSKSGIDKIRCMREESNPPKLIMYAIRNNEVLLLASRAQDQEWKDLNSNLQFDHFETLP